MEGTKSGTREGLNRVRSGQAEAGTEPGATVGFRDQRWLA